MGKIVPPALVTKTRRDVEQKPTIGEKDTTNFTQPSVSKVRADFRPEEFVRVIRQKGYFCIWRKAMICPCFNLRTNQCALNCDDCGGSGYQYIDPQLIQAVMTRFDRKDDVYKHAGHFFSGTAKATTEPQYRLGYRDSLELRDSVIVYNEYITKGNREALRQRLPKWDERKVDSARYKVVRSVAMLFKDSSNETRRVEEGTEFWITQEGWIEWSPAGDRLIPDGTTLSFNYEIRPVYIVTSHSNLIRNTVSARKRANPTVEALPIQVDVMLDYLDQSTENPSPVTGTVDGRGV